jgi:hypothetical protein
MAEVTDKNIKLEFIRQELQKHGEWLKGIFLEILTKYKHEISGNLINSISYKVTDTPIGPQLEFTFLDYGRFFDIGAYTSPKKKSNDWNDNVNKMLWGISGNKKKSKRELNAFYVEGGGALGSDGQKNAKYVKKMNKWYARTMYGGIGKLVSAIMYGLTDYEISRLKQELESR